MPTDPVPAEGCEAHVKLTRSILRRRENRCRWREFLLGRWSSLPTSQAEARGRKEDARRGPSASRNGVGMRDDASEEEGDVQEVGEVDSMHE